MYNYKVPFYKRKCQDIVILPAILNAHAQYNIIYVWDLTALSVCPIPTNQKYSDKG